jgi:viroplasmin and RNaseH domain-containing protein
LQQLPLKELLNQSEADKLHDALKKGNRLAVSFIKNGNEQRYYIEANPQFKSVNIYDEHARKITLNAALGTKTLEAVNLTQKSNERKEQSQTKKNGMHIS